MTATAKQLFEQAMALAVNDRIELIDRLSESLEPSSDPDYVRAWEAEIKARLDDIDQGRAKMIPAEQVLQRLRAEVKAASV